MPGSVMSGSAAGAATMLTADTAIIIRIRCIAIPPRGVDDDLTCLAARDSDKSALPLEARSHHLAILLASMWATARTHSRLRYQPAAIAHNHPGEWMADLDMKTEAAVFDMLISVDARREHERQRQPEQTPAPHHQPHS